MPQIGEGIEYSLKIPTPLLMSWVTVLVLFVVSWLAVRRPRETPGRLQAIFEAAFQFIFDLVDASIGPEGKSYYPLFLGLFFYILVGNLLGIVPGLTSPTANLNTTVALALVTFFSTHFFGIRKQGFFRYFGNFVAGVPFWLKPLMFVIELIEQLARPLSLSFRLFGNIMAKELLLGILAFLVVMLYSAGGVVDTAMTIVPLLLRPLIILLALLVGFIQAFIFTLLSIVYVGGAIKEHAERSH